jgi:hypothetical protein
VESWRRIRNKKKLGFCLVLVVIAFLLPRSTGREVRHQVVALKKASNRQEEEQGQRGCEEIKPTSSTKKVFEWRIAEF